MTPNKLPPLPERDDGNAPHDRLWDSQWVNIVNHTDVLGARDQEEAVHLAVKMTEQKMAENFRALRQSQSLPAGAVAGGDWYTSDEGSHIVDFDQDPSNQLSILLKRDGTVSAVATKNGNDSCGGYGLDEVANVIRGYALQADAREKGEVVTDSMVEAFCHVYWHGDWPYDKNDADRELCNELRAEVKAGMVAALATQPAQASEKESQRYTEEDGCPTEMAVLQRFWRANQEKARE